MEYDSSGNKKCPKCLEFKPIDQYFKDKTRSDGLTSYCKKCSLNNSKGYAKTERCKINQNRRQREIRSSPESGPELREKCRILKQKYNATAAGKYWNLRARAKKRNIGFDINQNEFEKWFIAQKMKCHYCKRDVVFGMNKNGNALNHLTIDRIDGRRGYAIGNIVFCCRMCNTIKGGWFSEREMVEIAKKYRLGEK